MDRKYIVVGDAPACGGSVLSFTCRPSDTINGHQKALIGGRVFCAACDSIGFIAKAGGPYRPGLCDAELALEGDVVECRCPVPPVLVSTLQNFASCDDRGGIQGRFDASCTVQNWYSPNPVDHMYHYKKSLDLARTDSTKPKNNADSITGYIMWETYFGI